MTAKEFAEALALRINTLVDHERRARATEVAALRTALSETRDDLSQHTDAPGPPGKDGVDGKDGADGKDGVDGKDGKDGLDGKDGKDGIGEKGLDGKDGKDGRDGRDGKDGVASVDEIKAIAAEFVATAVAAAVEKAVADAFAALPILTYKGVWREGTEYLPGNTATWAGSIWHCNAPTQEKPGNGSTDWTLAVKKGRDGSPTAHRA